MQPLIYDIPKTGLEGKFSMRYCIASAMIDGGVKIGTFEPAQIERIEVQRLMNKIMVEIDPRVENDHEFAAIVEVRLKSGQQESLRIDVASGKPGNWLSQALLKEKFFDCMGTEDVSIEDGKVFFELAQNLVIQSSIEPLYLGLLNTLGKGHLG
jgi:2-methylcitrate dehydratase PrpD